MSTPVDGFAGPVEDFELALGHVTGVRGFKIDHLDRLVGVTKRKVFRPGENTATCGNGPVDDISDHVCGYYAYFQEEGVNDPNFYGAEVGAVVRGYGRTIVGTKGFRAEKADLVALFSLAKPKPALEPAAEPKKVELPKPSFFARFYPRTGWFLKSRHTALDDLALIASILLGSLVILFPIEQISSGNFLAGVVFLLTGSATLAWLIGFQRRTWGGKLARVDIEYPSLPMPNVKKLESLTLPGKNYIRPEPAAVKASSGILYIPGETRLLRPEDSRFETLQKLYPGIPVYTSLEEAVKAHPLTTAEEVTPPPPSPENTEDFWDLPPNEDPQITANSLTYGSISINSYNSWP